MTRSTDTPAYRITILDLFRFLHRESSSTQIKVVIATILTGVSRGLLLATFNLGAAAVGRHGTADIRLIATFVAVLVIYLAAGYASGRLGDRLVRALIQALRLRICEKLIKAPLRLIETLDPGKIFTHIGHEVEQLANAGKDFVISFQSAIVLVFALGYLAWLSTLVFLFAVLTIIVSASAFYWQQHKAKLSYTLSRAKETEYFEAMYDLLHGFKELKLGRAQQYEISDHLKKVSAEFRALGAASANRYQLSEMTSQAFTFSFIAIIVFVLPVFSPINSTSINQLLVTVFYVLGPVEQLIATIPSFAKATVALDNIQRLERTISAEPPFLSPKVEVQPAAPFHRIVLSNIHFEFRGATDDESFDLGPINLELARGEALFICGGNGAGKTTLLKLLAGLYQPTSGDLFVDGRKISGAGYDGYRELFAVVFSDTHLLRQLYGLSDPDPGLVRELLVSLQLDRKTRLEKNKFTSTNLSAGQRRRLAYAISRLRDRQIYVFDEFAADQDPAFRQYFYTVLLPDLKKQGKTIIAVTHDDRWFDAGDRLVKLEYGKIVTADRPMATAMPVLGPA